MTRHERSSNSDTRWNTELAHRDTAAGSILKSILVALASSPKLNLSSDECMDMMTRILSARDCEAGSISQGHLDLRAHLRKIETETDAGILALDGRNPGRTGLMGMFREAFGEDGDRLRVYVVFHCSC